MCNVLNLTLGPLDLNLLGLRVQLNQVVLNITAIPGGGLLGDLLCGLAGGPVPAIPTGLQQIIACSPKSSALSELRSSR